MVSNANQTTLDSPVNQGVRADIPEPNKIGASTPYDFEARNLTAYGGLLPVATMLEKLGFQQLVEETLTVKRQTRSMPMYGFILGMVLACYVGFSRLNHLRFLKREPMLTGILRVARTSSAVHLLAFSGLAASGRGAATADGAVAHAGTGLGSGQRATRRGHRGHRHHGAHAVRQPDGRAQKLQPEEQGEEELSAHPELYRRDAGVRGGRVAQRRPARRAGDCRRIWRVWPRACPRE